VCVCVLSTCLSFCLMFLKQHVHCQCKMKMNPCLQEVEHFCNIYRHFISACLGLIFAKNYYTSQQHASCNTYCLWHKRPADIGRLNPCDHSVVKFINGLLFMFVRFVHFKLTTRVVTFSTTVLLLA
jgi:hypothetical protein